jgi:hypothetical protein
MASAIQLVSQHSIASGNGLAVSANLLAAINSFQRQAPVKTLQTVFFTAKAADANISPILLTALNNLGSGVTNGSQWLLDLYPGNITAVCSSSIQYYGNGHTPSMSSTIRSQAEIPWAHGMSGFANVYQTTSSYASQIFDTVSSVNLLQGKTYALSGLGYTGPLDLATGGIGNNADLLNSIVSSWGTMYDIKNIGTFSDPYVFGQNLLNQNLGSYGNLSIQLQSAGLNIYNLSQVPQGGNTTTSVKSTVVTTSTPIGPISLPTIGNVTTTTTVNGKSVDVVNSIYGSITGADLQQIITATGISTFLSNTISTLADYLNFNKVISPKNVNRLATLGITDLKGLSDYLQAKVGQGSFTSWQALGNFLSTLEVPSLNYTSANSSTVALPDSIATNYLTTLGSGSGPFNNSVVADYLGATAGIPYTSLLGLLSDNSLSFDSVVGLTPAINVLESAVNSYIGAYVPGNDESGPVIPDISPVNAAVTTINATLNSITPSPLFANCQTYYYDILNHMTSEVSNMSKAGVVFNSGYTQVLQNFAQRVGSDAADKTQYQKYQFFSNLITNDSYGDTIRSAIAETINTQLLSSMGISINNNPSPAILLAKATAQNAPISTYITQNK